MTKAIFLTLALLAGASGSALAAIAYHSPATTGINAALPYDGVTAGTVVINRPAATVTGDVLIATISARPSGMTIPTPAGWTLVRRTEQVSGGPSTLPGGMTLLTYSRVVANLGTEPASYTWSLTNAYLTTPALRVVANSGGVAGGIVAFGGVDQSTPVNVEGGNLTASGFVHTANAITTTVANTMLVSSITYLSASSFGAPTGPAGITEALDVSAPTVANAIGLTLQMSYAARAATGSTGAVSATATGANGDNGVGHMLALKPGITTLATGADPGVATIAPGAVATDVDLFTLQTSGGTEAITSVTVNLSTNSGVGRLAITDNAGTELGFTTTPVTGSNTITVAGMSATTTLTTFKVRITPLSHAAMPAVPGAAYAITAPVTAWAGPNTHAGSDTDTNALTIDNLSPAGATAVSGSAGAAQVTINWTTSASADFSRSVMLRWTGGAAGAEVPAEGTDYVNGNIIGTATVVCVRTADAASTAVSGVDGAGTGGCSATALASGQAYTYKIFQKDSNGNYSAGVAVGTFTTLPTTTLATGADPAATTIAPGVLATDVDLFTLQTSSGTEAITSVTVNLSTNSGIGLLAITTSTGVVLGSTASPVAGSNTITLAITATTTLTTFKVRITPLSHALMPAVPGAAYAITAPVTAWAGPNTHAGSDTDTNALTIDNLSPAGATATSGSASNAKTTLNWTASSSADFATTSGSVVYRWAAASAGAEVPAEGSTPTLGATNGTATVACLVSSAVSAPLVRIDGTGGSADCTTAALINGQAYTYKVFQKDTSGNYDVGVLMGTFTALPRVVSINCSVSCAATSAATVSWTVTFSMSVTGVDASAFTLAATGVSGAYITAVTGSGTTWTVTANTGIGSGTLGLNQTGPGSVAPTLSGTFTGQIYPISATPALAEYRMDEASWNGTANEVVDSSGSGNHAQAFNSASTTDGSRAIAGSPGTCRYGLLNGGYVQAPLPNLTTDFTITAWIRTTNNAAVGQRILIDDESNTGGYGFSFSDAGLGVLRFYSRGITSNVILDSTYPIANNTWYFVAAVADITNKMRTIYVFNQSGVLQSTTTEVPWTSGTWGTDGGPVSIGGETIASGESALHFVGNLDEVRVYQKVLSQNALTAIATQTHVCPINVPNHLEIQSSGSGLTCAASTLTIKACTDAAIPCATPYTLGVSGTLSAAGAPTVNWDGTTGGAAGAGFAIPGGGSSVTKNVQVATAGSVVFGITSPSPVPTNATVCNFGSPSCTFTASLAGFIFSNTTASNTYTIPSQVSGTATSALYLRAVQAATTNPAVCTPAIISQTTAATLGYTCNNPVACQAGNLATITNTITSTATSIAPGGTAVSLNFDANGSAPITARYDDAGQITLNANKTVTPFGGATAITLNGSSNAFVVRPDHFDLSGIQQTAAPNLVNPAALDATGNKFVKAGEQFSVMVTARNSLNAATPNFGKETTQENVKLTSALVAGLGLTNNPAVSGTFGAFSNGVATGTAFTWNEVGIIKLTPGILSGNYLGVAGDTTGTQSGNVGRFYAAQLALTGGVIANRTDIAACPAPAGCGTFTYMGEQMSAVFNLTAKAVDGTTTLQNYNWSATAANQFAKLNPLAAVTAGTGGPLNMGAVDSAATRTPFPPCGVIPAHPCLTPAQATAGTFASGVASITVPLTLYRDNAAAAGPYALLDVGVNPADSDGAALATLDLAVNGGGSPNTHGKVGSTQTRYGRLKMQNIYGSEKLPLAIPLQAQYWNGSYFINNADDSSTGLSVPWSVTASPTGVPNLYFYPVTGTSKNQLSSSNTTASLGTPALVKGVDTLRFTAPGALYPGWLDIILQVPDYLKYNWGNCNGQGTDTLMNDFPCARATFGIYKSPLIYRRENY